MRIGVFIQETWGFFTEIYTDLQHLHQTSIFTPRKINAPIWRTRLNDYFYKRAMHAFMANQDVLFFEWASELLAQATRLPKTTPIVTRLHRYELYQWAHLINWDAVDRVILVTEAKRQEFCRRFPTQAQKSIVIPEAVSLERFQSNIKSFNGDIGILCHLTPRKRVYELILAFAELLKRQAGFHLHIGGGEHERFRDYHEALHQLVRRLNLQEHVTFYGNVSDPEKWYRYIDVMVSNSYSEGLQVSPLEAIASGCYCLCHTWDGADEFYPAENLFIGEGELVEKLMVYSRNSPGEKEASIRSLQQILKSSFDIDKTKLEIRKLIEATVRQ
jgi:glycosyltransferase involved in cell wall biosynthesis